MIDKNATAPGCHHFTRSFRPARALLLIGLVAAGGLLVSCASPPENPRTLADIDKPHLDAAKVEQDVVPEQTTQAVKRVWYEYMNSAGQDDIQRAQAVRRIAELELSAETDAVAPDPGSEAEFESRVRDIIKMLRHALRSFPDASGNDETLYQLAKAYDQLGEGDEAILVLQELVARYPRTRYFAEARFRMGENAFVRGDYAAAERAYTDVLHNRSKTTFQDKAFFKRGWSRFKQQKYLMALEDYFAAADLQSVEASPQTQAERELYDEHLRALGLTFIQLGGAAALREFFTPHGDRTDSGKAPGSGNVSTDSASRLKYPVYAKVSDLLAEQQRHADAVDALQAYVRVHPRDPRAVDAALRVVGIWKDAGLFSQYLAALDRLYLDYRPEADYWQHVQIDFDDKAAVFETMRQYMLQLGSHFHDQFQKSQEVGSYNKARRWYERYLQSFSAFARQEKIYPLLAELFKQAGELEQALHYHERAAFDGDLLLDKDSAYACLVLSSQLYQGSDEPDRDEWLTKHLAYAGRFAELYPAEAVSGDVVGHAVQLAFKHQRHDKVIDLANGLPDQAAPEVRLDVNRLKAQAMFELARYADAEVVYQDLLADPQLAPADREGTLHRWALSVYKQGEAARSGARAANAREHFLRVYKQRPQSPLAPNALYDAIVLFMNDRQWNQAIAHLQAFQAAYPEHRLMPDVGKRLSEAYLEADRPLDAAQTFEQLAEAADAPEEKMAALWRAAELYAGKGDSAAALRAWQNYADRYPRPLEPYMEALNHVAQLYGEIRNESQRRVWLRKIVEADAQTSASARTARSQFVAAGAAFELAQLRLGDFDRIRLAHPLPDSLQRKKAAMQETTRFFGLASQYGHPEFVTRSTFEIADMYRRFAVSLLESERPTELSTVELEQYNFLLEDQAFPFEDKAIEFYEINVARIREGHFDEWVQHSLEQLSKLFPARYARQGKIESSIRQL